MRIFRNCIRLCAPLILCIGTPLSAQNSPAGLLNAGTQTEPARISPRKDAAPESSASGKGNEEAASMTIIDAMKRTKFDPKQNKVVFQGNVQVEDPRFFLKCDILTAFLKRNSDSDKKKKNAAPEAKTEGATETAGKEIAATVPGATPAADSKGSGGLESAEAEGNVEIVQERVTPEGKNERNVIRARRAVYESSTESITLMGWPQVWQSHNGNSLKALREDTVMVLNKAGDVDVTGPAKSVFVNPSKNGK